MIKIDIELVPSLFLLFSAVGIYAAYLFGRNTKRFKWSEYIAMLFVPVIGSLLLSVYYGIKVIYLFFISAIVGLLLEYILGLAYHKTLNKRLWTYDRLSLHGYTSFLAIPMWGVAGTVFWLLSNSIGL